VGIPIHPAKGCPLVAIPALWGTESGAGHNVANHGLVRWLPCPGAFHVALRWFGGLGWRWLCVNWQLSIGAHLPKVVEHITPAVRPIGYVLNVVCAQQGA